MERTPGWLNRFRAILVRWDKKAASRLAGLDLAAADNTLSLAGTFGMALSRDVDPSYSPSPTRFVRAGSRTECPPDIAVDGGGHEPRGAVAERNVDATVVIAAGGE